ncbi:amidohydrolase family protein [Glacieibacterium sp.]|uniref:Xaa-Pro dipeptidase n=1 Tax=Glacieibacterium sp. TaxID=2860237 RepID=UPI003AFFC6D3
MRIVLLAATMAGLIGSTASAETVAISAARMLDVVTGKMVASPMVIVTDGRIVAAGPTSSVSVPAGARRLDLSSLTLLPGLIDMHVHLTSDPTIGGYRVLDYTPAFWTVIGVANAKSTLQAGFTTVRNVGSSNYDDVGLKQAIEAGYVAGPRIVPATYAMGATGGHCDTTEYPPNINVDTPAVANGVEAIRATVRKLRKYGAEVIKFCGTGGVFSKTDSVGGQQYTQEEMNVLVSEAHMLGMRVAVHAHGTAGINTALRAGTDTIEHASLADDESFALAKKNGSWFSMDIYDDDYILAQGTKNGVFQESLDKEKAIGRAQRETFRRAVKSGVKMVFGTDAGVYPHGTNALQFATMVEWGMTPLQAIQAATLNAGEALGRSKDVGAIAAGRYGDMIAVAGDPLTDVKLLQHVAVVIKGGVVEKDAR